MLEATDLPSPDRQLFSVGYCCQLLQVLPGQLKVLMDDTGVSPFWMLDGVAFFDGDGVQVLVNKANQLRKEIAEAAEKLDSAESN